MNYELAKELKDAGFPQWAEEPRTGARAYTNEREIVEYDDGFWRNGEPVYSIPTLEELIEACGDIVLWKNGEQWSADFFNGKDKIYIDEYFDPNNGTTPTEAVARLWLSLNKQ